MSTASTEISLPALQGSSLLGFLAALGALKTLTSFPEWRTIRLKWIPGGASYYPVLHLPPSVHPSTIVEKLHTGLGMLANHYVITADKDLKIPCRTFRALAIKAANDHLSGADAMAAGLVAAFGSDGVSNDDQMIEDTAFRTMSGAGHQHFLEFMNELAKQTTADQIREALFGPWRYQDPSPIMRWDSEDDRRYALRWDEPSKDPVRTVRGANLLAIAALPLFPTAPVSATELATTGFKGKGSRRTFVTWPIWNGWLSLDSVCSLLNLQELQIDEVNSSALSPRGISAVYRSQRITLGKYRNFTPAQPL